MSDHHIGHFRNVGLAGLHITNILAISQDCHTVRQRFYLVHLMGDNDNRFSIISHFTKYTEQFFRLLRGQHCRRLIQNQNVRTAVKYFYNLHGLLLRNRHIINLLLRIHFKSIFFTDVCNLSGCFFNIQLSFQTQYNIFRSRQYIHQFEMLMHHTNAQL